MRPDQMHTDLIEAQSKVSVALKGVAETLLISLAARAFDANSQNPILGDPYAKGVLDRLEYDLEKVNMAAPDSAGVAIRTRQFDKWTSSFLNDHPHCTVLHLACGLDSRMQRVDWGNGVRWIDVDLPEVITLRRQIMPTSLPGREYMVVGASVIEKDWLEEIPADRPTLVVMEGLLSYLTEKDVNGLLSHLVNRFKRGEMVFECISSTVLSSLQKKNIKAVEKTGASFHWAVDDLGKVQDIHPHLDLAEAMSFFEAPGVENFPFSKRIMCYLISWVPSLRQSARFVRFKFSPEAVNQTSHSM